MSLLDFDKAQTDYLKASLKTSHRGGICPWLYGHDDEKNNTILSDGYFLVVVPDVMCFVKPNGREISADTIKRNLLPETDQHQLTDTGMSTAVKGTKDTAHIFRDNETGEDIWINNKYLAYFEKMSVRYAGKGMRNPVMVYWGDTLVGVVLPISHK